MASMNKSQNMPKLRVTRKLGDLPIWDGLQRTPNFKLLFTDMDAVLAKIFKDWRQFTTGILASIISVPLRVFHGKNQMGIILTISGTSLMLAANSTHIWFCFASLGIFYIPIVPFFCDWPQIYEYIFVDIRSIPLLCHTILYFLSGLINTIMVYIGKGNKEASKRGDSYIALILRKIFIRKGFMPDEFIISLIEVIFIASLGVFLWRSYQDYYYAIVLWLSAFSELCQQLNDKSYQNRHEGILNA